MSDAGLAEFAAFHEPALLRAEIRHGIMLHNLLRAKAERLYDFAYWTLGDPGACALRMAPYSIVLGELDQNQCRRLAALTAELDYSGAIGSDKTVSWFVECATELGILFGDAERQLVHGLDASPAYPGSAGYPRRPTQADAPLFAAWIAAFYREAVPHDRLPSADDIAGLLSGCDFLLWIDDDRPVSIAGIRRRVHHSAAISHVYTPPEWRGRGYAGSVTAAIADRILAEGYKTACLYTDLANPASNRCYRKIGFRPVCRSMHVHRAAK